MNTACACVEALVRGAVTADEPLRAVRALEVLVCRRGGRKRGGCGVRDDVAEACYWLGCVYEGLGNLRCDPDNEKAQALFQIAADKGFSPACAALGLQLLSSAGANSNPSIIQRSRELCHSAIAGLCGDLASPDSDAITSDSWLVEVDVRMGDMHSGRACVALGEMAMYGRGGSQNIAWGVHLFRLAAKVGQPTAFYHLGYLHQNGIGVPEDHVLCQALYRHAAKLGNASAMTALAWILLQESHFEDAVWYLQQAVLRDSAPAMEYLAVAYMDGLGVDHDADLALHLLTRASRLGWHGSVQRHTRTLASRGGEPFQIRHANTLRCLLQPASASSTHQPCQASAHASDIDDAPSPRPSSPSMSEHRRPGSPTICTTDCRDTAEAGREEVKPTAAADEPNDTSASGDPSSSSSSRHTSPTILIGNPANRRGDRRRCRSVGESDRQVVKSGVGERLNKRTETSEQSGRPGRVLMNDTPSASDEASSNPGKEACRPTGSACKRVTRWTLWIAGETPKRRSWTHGSVAAAPALQVRRALLMTSRLHHAPTDLSMSAPV